jgi:hypothetical protein
LGSQSSPTVKGVSNETRRTYALDLSSETQRLPDILNHPI